MNAHMRRAAVAAVATSMAVALAACGSAKDSGSGSASSAPKKTNSDNITVGLLLPENQTYRYEAFDRPLIEKEVKSLTHGKGKVLYNNAKQQANTQAQQVDTMIANKVNVLIVDAVDSASIKSSVQKAKDAGIPVVAYDRLAEGPISAYTSFDNTKVGEVQGQALLQALGSKAKSSQIVMMNGSLTDPNAKQFKDGAHSVLDGKVTIKQEYDTKDWKPEVAGANMTGAISAIGKNNIAGVYSANDDMAQGIITALNNAGVKKVPVTGQDATLAGVQRIVAGTQYMSVFKSYPEEAKTAGQMAVALAKGQSVDAIGTTKVDSPSEKQIPSKIVPVSSLTKANVNDLIIKPKFYSVAQICTSQYKAACAAAGIK